MQCCGTNRPFDMDIVDWNGNEVVHLDRPFACDSCCCCCCLQSMEVSSQSRPLGTIEQKWTCCSPEFAIKDDSANTVLTMSGPVCTWSCFGSDVEFKVLTPSGGEVGVIAKKWVGFIKIVCSLYTIGLVFGGKFMTVRFKMFVNLCKILSFI